MKYAYKNASECSSSSSSISSRKWNEGKIARIESDRRRMWCGNYIKKLWILRGHHGSISELPRHLLLLHYFIINLDILWRNNSGMSIFAVNHKSRNGSKLKCYQFVQAALAGWEYFGCSKHWRHTHKKCCGWVSIKMLRDQWICSSIYR